MCFVRLGDFAGYFSFLWDWYNISFLGVWFSDTFGVGFGGMFVVDTSAW